MTDHRQCGRCGRTDAIPGTAIDAPHDCPHGVKCEATGNLYVYRCQKCVEARVAQIRERAALSLPGARIAFGLERP